jgi:hypothetical protein
VTGPFVVDGTPDPVATWRLIPCEVNCPPPRYWHTMVLDETRDRMIVFAGCTGQGAAKTPYNDVWALDLASDTWSELHPSGMLPAPRVGHLSVFDTQSNRMVMFGGYAFGAWGGGFWELSFATGTDGVWSEVISPWSTPSPPEPYRVSGFTSCPNDAAERGGGQQVIVMVDLYKLPSTIVPAEDVALVDVDLSGGGVAASFVPASDAGSVPSPRPPLLTEHPPCVYDAGHDRLIMTGSHTPPTGYVFGAWEFSLAPGAEGWRSLAQSYDIPPFGYLQRLMTPLVFDPTRNCAVLFSGGVMIPDSGDNATRLLHLDLPGFTHWRCCVASGVAPSPRSAHTMVYDPVRDRFILFAGGGSGLNNDTWELRF